MVKRLIALGAGLCFGAGLALSQMIDPRRIQGFLDVRGAWDPLLLFVFTGALGVTLISFRFILAAGRPWWAKAFDQPKRRSIDRSLLMGALLFGVGWGLTGYCPGPALAALPVGGPALWVYLLGMALGLLYIRR
jgi:uncharacterized membrane protein YedE/YeeE